MKIAAPETLWRRGLVQITKEEQKAGLAAYLFGLLLYVPMIIWRLNCSDGNICGILYRPDGDYDIEDIAGRYLLKYAAHLKSMYVFSWLAVIFGLFCMVWGAIYICRILRITHGRGILVCALFVMVSPCFTETFPYYFAADAYLLCFPLVTGAVVLLHEKVTVLRAIAAAGMLFLSMTFYQAYLMVAVTLFLFVLVRDLLDRALSFREIGRKLAFQMGSGIAAFVLYTALNKVLKMVGLIYYQESRFNLTDLLKWDVLKEAFPETYATWYRYYFTNLILNNSWKGRSLMHAALLLFGALVLGLILYRTREGRDWKNVLALAAAIVVIPFAMMGIAFLNYLEGAPRIMMLPTASLFYIGIWALWYRLRRICGEENVRNLLGWGLYAVTGYLLVIMTFYIGIYQLCMKYYVDKTDSMAQRIITRIEEEYPETTAGSKVFICGDVDEGNYPQNYRIEQASYIMAGTQACDGMFVNNMQGYFAGWNLYMTYNMGVEYEMVWERAQEIYDSEQYREMPLFPAEGSVQKTEDDIVVVKLTE